MNYFVFINKINYVHFEKVISVKSNAMKVSSVTVRKNATVHMENVILKPASASAQLDGKVRSFFFLSLFI